MTRHIEISLQENRAEVKFIEVDGASVSVCVFDHEPSSHEIEQVGHCLALLFDHAYKSVPQTPEQMRAAFLHQLRN